MSQFAVLPYLHGVTDHIGRLLSWRSVRPIFKLTRKMQQFLRPVKNARDSCSVPCSCGEIYIGTMKHSIHTCIGEHNRCCRLRQPEKSAVAEHALANADHRVLFEETKVLFLVSAYLPRLHMESVPIQKHAICLLYTSRCV